MLSKSLPVVLSIKALAPQMAKHLALISLSIAAVTYAANLDNYKGSLDASGHKRTDRIFVHKDWGLQNFYYSKIKVPGENGKTLLVNEGENAVAYTTLKDGWFEIIYNDVDLRFNLVGYSFEKIFLKYDKKLISLNKNFVELSQPKVLSSLKTIALANQPLNILIKFGGSTKVIGQISPNGSGAVIRKMLDQTSFYPKVFTLRY